MMTPGNHRARNLEYVHYSPVNESVTSSSTVLQANDGTEYPSSSDSAGAVATFKTIFGHWKSVIIAAVILVAVIGVMAMAVTVALYVRGRHSHSEVTSPDNQSYVTTTTVELVSSSSSPSSTITVITMTSVSSLAPTTTVKLINSSCQSSEFTCSNLECVSLELVCNGIPDCTDGSDEHPLCVCRDGQFRCPNGQCVPSSAVCDQNYDCLDKGDEAVCPDCAGFRCVSNNVCLWDRMSRKCDQVFDCEDFSDELNCESLPSRYHCSNGASIHSSKVCDGLDDCGDNSDETSCVCKNRRQFSCSDQPGKCIPSTWRCDGHPDCFQATDEDSCGVCHEGYFQCSDYTCVNSSLRCDGNVDCMVSGGDEDGCVELTSVNKLQVLLAGRMYPVCSDDWTEAHSNWVCETLHARSVLSTSSVRQVPPFSQFAVLKGPKSTVPVGHFVVSDACSSEATIHIKCRDAGCGQRKVDFLESYIAGGNVASPGKWPWVVSLAYLGKPICGGVLIEARWVLTAAHCVLFAVDTVHDYSKVPFYYTIRAGAVVISGNVSISQGHQPQDVRVSKIYIHPKRSLLDNGGVDWDIALLLLEDDVIMSDFVQPLCLPSYAQVFASTSFCYLAGWGILSYRQHLRATQLRDTRMQLWSEDRCSKNTVIGEQFVNTNSTICAGFLSGRPTGCQGDSGGPLMCLDPASRRYILAGLVSRGSGECGLLQLNARSNRFARVAMAVPWIDEILNR